MNQVNPLNELQPMQDMLRAARMRVPVLLTGSREDTLMQVDQWQQQSRADVLWLSDRSPPGAWRLPAGKANHELGREADAVVVDMFSGIDVDAIAALAGAVRAGGWMIVLAPSLSEWAAFSDPGYARITVEPFGVAGVRRHFLARMARWFANDARVIRLEAGKACHEQWALSLPPASLRVDEQGCITRQQQQTVSDMVQWFNRSGSAPLVLMADRGRGKSAALGIVARQLKAQGVRILVTAPRPEAAATLLRFANEPGVNETSRHSHNPVTFIAPDRLLQTLPDADVLLVDEAAALAPPLLINMLQHYPRVIFATTVQGYEGTGQGFLTRFSRHLDTHYAGWQTLRLTQPIRWAEGDPLESFINDWLLLNACAEPAASDEPFTTDHLQLEELTPHLNTLGESTLRSVHGLLVSAHYRTRPSDFRTLLDGPNMRTWCVRWQGHVVAVAMLAEEGCLPEPLCVAIESGQRRPHGHVLAQSLAVHLNVSAALRQRSWRIVRIAVHSHYQRQGIGRWLLQQLEQSAAAEQVPLLGSLFAAAPDVLAFWQRSGFEAVRVGITRESTSGAFPVMVVKAVDVSGRVLADQARQRFEQIFLPGLADAPDPWPAELVLLALGRPRFPPSSDWLPGDQQDLAHFIAGHKTYENAAVALQKKVRQWIEQGRVQHTLSGQQQRLLIGKVLQKQRWPELIAHGEYSGQKQIRQALRDAIGQLQSDELLGN